MNKILFILLGWLIPNLIFAASSSSSLNFTPPPTDYSVIFLSNIFGTVDGVLTGTGSQILGVMFGVFNSAVLALGGIVILYVLMVATLNTAHEGQVLGEKWSSLWIPLRSVLGLALLIPKASGYGALQILTMWIVVQGCGAADKIWNTALDYMQSGGVIISQNNVNQSYISQLAGSLTSIGQVVGAETILSGQVCMLGLQTALENQRQSYLTALANNSGACAGTPSTVMQQFCKNPVPNFLNSVNFVAVQTAATVDNASATARAQMPYFTTAPYNALNGVCGTIQWTPYSTTNLSLGGSVTSSEMSVIQQSRAIALQQMYDDLAFSAVIMVNNDPLLNQNLNSSSPASLNAVQQFGVPITASGALCSPPSNPSASNLPTCTQWGPDSGSDSAPIFTGSEISDAVADYNNIMSPAISLQQASNQQQQNSQARAFIQNAEQYGWMMAGSYFYNLVQLNALSVNNLTTAGTDQNTGIDASSFSTAGLSGLFNTANTSNATTTGSTSCPSVLCTWFNGSTTYINAIIGLINGQNVTTTNPLSIPITAGGANASQSTNTSNNQPNTGPLADTVFGFLNNSLMVQPVTSQPGTSQWSWNFNFTPAYLNLNSFSLPQMSFACGKVKLLGCVGRLIGDVIYNDIIRNVFNIFITQVINIVATIIQFVLFIPLQTLAGTFLSAVQIIQQPNTNPILALAMMGAQYINDAANIWIALFASSISYILILGIFGYIIILILTLAVPLLLAWLSVMATIGFLTAFYIPFLPYMIFTFGTIAWLMIVVEAMAASPIVAIGVMFPEGHQAFGKADAAIMILFNIFLRPPLMIIGFIAAIALSYVSTWTINAGFSNAMSLIQTSINTSANNYVSWTAMYGYFFCVLMYTSLYLIVVQKSFGLINNLPDRVLRWIGQQAESVGQEVMQWGEEARGQVSEAGKATMKGQAQAVSKVKEWADDKIGAAIKHGNTGVGNK